MDKTSKKIILKLQNCGKGTEYICAFDEAWSSSMDCVIDDLAKELGYQTEDVRSAVRFLHEQGYLEYTTSRGRNIGFHLSHKGLNYQYFRKQEILRYIADKWIDFFAMLLSVAALVISIISLLS